MNKRKKAAALLSGPAAVCGAALFLTRGRSEPAVPASMQGVRYAHRGLHSKPEIPENSLAAFRRAAELGFGAEFDVHLLRDGTLAVMHDSDLKRTTGVSGLIEELTEQELSQLRLEGSAEKVPLFDEVLAVFEGRAPVIIELKTAGGNAQALAEAVCRRLDAYSGVFCVESFDPRAVYAVRRFRPAFCRGQLSENYLRRDPEYPLWQRLAMSLLLVNVLSRPDFVAFNVEDRRSPALWLCRRLWKLQEVSWTVRSPEDLRQVEADGGLVIFEGFVPDA